jgi:hypothetical protein
LNFIDRGKSGRDENRKKLILETREAPGQKLKSKEFIRK